jgi:hypothetical protein
LKLGGFQLWPFQSYLFKASSRAMTLPKLEAAKLEAAKLQAAYNMLEAVG